MKPKTPGFRVLIKPDSLHEYDPVYQSAKKSGIQLVETTERKELTGVDTGVVVEVGPIAYHGYGDGTPWVKEGDRVSYVRHGGKFVSDPDNKENKWLVVNDEDIVMVWENV